MVTDQGWPLIVAQVLVGACFLGFFVWYFRHLKSSGARTAARRSKLLDDLVEGTELVVQRREDPRYDLALNGVPVELRFVHHHKKEPRLDVRVGRHEGISAYLALVRRGHRLGGAVMPKGDRETGDEPFDRAITLLGHRSSVACALTPEARALALEVVGELGCEVQDGLVRKSVFEAKADPEELRTLVPRMVALARALDVGEPDDGRLATLVSAETCPVMAGQIAEVLFTRHPEGKRTARAARSLADHPDPRARLFAAVRLHPEGPALLRRIVGDAIDEQVLRQALEWAADRLEPPLVQAAALEAIELADERLQREACSILGRLAGLKAVGPLRRLAKGRARDAATAAIEAIRSRHPGEADGGGLELAAEDPREGGLELAEGPAGGGLELAE